jgi:hypothetical protein
MGARTFTGSWIAVKSKLTGISEEIARQKVNVLMLEKVSNLLLAGEPVLMPDSESKWVWRVPVYLTFPSYGRVSHIGDIDVDAHKGELRYDRDLLIQFEAKTSEAAQQVLNSSV